MTNRRELFIVVAGLALLSLALVGCESEETTMLAPGAQAEGISVSGSGSAFGAPDVAVLQMGVSVLKPSVKEARQQAASAMQDVVDSMKDNGIEEKDIQTTRFSVHAEYDYRNDRQELRGFRVTNIVTAKLRDIDKTGDVLDDVIEAGADLVEVQSVNFTIDDPDELREEARREAVDDARQKAETLAELAGVDMGKPLSITEAGGRVPISYRGATEMAVPLPDEAPTPIEVGELEVSIDVQIVYAIE
ncbi:MAG: SIMPL domain-containing protein [Dehalococcoidia bacterium]